MLQRTPWPAHSSARTRVQAVAAAFDAQYEAMPIRGVVAALEDTTTIAPRPRAIISSATTEHTLTTPPTLT